MTLPQPLAGVRVLDLATFVAAPFCGTILADFGAEVIKIEQPGVGDPLRRFGTPSDCGDTYVWLSEARNRRFATLDLRTSQGASLLRALVADTDVLLENFRPGTLEAWGLGYETLKAINPRLVMLRVSAYGQDGPLKDMPGFARVAHAFGGLAFLSGQAGGPPVVPGSTSLADYVSGMWGAIGVLMALRSADRTGEGQVVDIALYESVFRLLDELAPVFARTGFVRERMGADTVNVAPHSHFLSGDGKWLALACTNQRMFERLTAAMERPDLVDDPRYDTMSKRVERRVEVNGLVTDWMGTLSGHEVLERCRTHEVPCALLYSIEDIFEDSQYAARGNLERLEDARAGSLVLPAAVPRLSGTPARLQRAGGALGHDNLYVFGTLLGLSEDRIERLRETAII
jgi:crotonobetainyl-CoA:carnitine CoA-transferase CaiB-like acyl-CoA transferase